MVEGSRLQPREVMDPPFATSWQAYGFAVTLLFFLLLPFALGLSKAVHRPDVYKRIPERFGGFSYMGEQIFEETSDIDILFLGSSVLWYGIDAPYIRDELSKKLGRQANVIMFGSNWRGEELNYLLLRDVLARRRVKLLVMTMPLSHQSTNLPHPQSHRWLPNDLPESTLTGLSLRSRLALYGEQMVGAPRHLLGVLRTDIHEDTEFHQTLRYLRGSYRVEGGYFGAPFVLQTTRPPLLSADQMIYSPGTRDSFKITHQPLSDYQMHFLRLMTNLARDSGVQMAIVNVPVARDRRETKVIERMNWPEVFGMNMSLIGVPAATLFRGMSDVQIDRCYYDEHMNLNGSGLFTKTLAPAILTVYEQTAQQSP